MNLVKKKYVKPQLIKFTDEEMTEIIFAGASSTGGHNPLAFCPLNSCSTGGYKPVLGCLQP